MTEILKGNTVGSLTDATIGRDGMQWRRDSTVDVNEHANEEMVDGRVRTGDRV